MKKLNTYIFAIALAATAAAIPAQAAKPEIRIDSVRHVVILPAIEGGADVAVSMIDRRISTPDTVTTIASQLLLQSDLRGHIEDAAWYLRAPAEEALPAADALMLTQGWTRYDIPAVIAGTVNDSLPYPIEIGAQLDGVIRSKWRGKPLAGASANIIAPKLDFATAAITDSTGHFSMAGFEWPDSTLFIISAWNSKGKNEENIELISEQFPALTTFPISSEISISSNQGNDPAVLHRLNRSSQRIMVSLNEVIVTNTEPLKLNNIVATITSANFYPGKDPGITSYEQAFRNIPGLNIEGEWAHYRGRPLSIWVDEKYAGITSPHYHEKISNASSGAINESEIMTRALPLTDLEGFYPYMENRSVSYITPTLSSLFNHSYSKGGVLYITTKHYGKSKNKLSDNLRAIQPLGYQKPREFYLVKYTPEGVAEEQTSATLRWLPSVDLSRPLELPLPPDMSWSDVSISIEGLTPQGSIVAL